MERRRRPLFFINYVLPFPPTLEKADLRLQNNGASVLEGDWIHDLVVNPPPFEGEKIMDP